MTAPGWPTVGPDPVVDELGAARDELARLDHAGTGLLDRDAVLGLLRARIARLVFGEGQ